MIGSWRTSLVWSVWATMLSCCSAPNPAASPPAKREASPSAPLRVLAIGDSVTQGRRGNGKPGDLDGPTQSWRYPFWKALQERRAHVDMVGTLQDGFEGNPDWPSVAGVSFDRNHESHWGWELNQVTEMLRQHLPSLQADVALIALGGNDIRNGDSLEKVMAEWRELLTLLRSHLPHIAIIIGAACADFHPIDSYNREILAKAPGFSTADSPVSAADGCRGWVSDPKRPESDTLDWVHPNARGDEKIARAFLKALEPWLPVRTQD